MEKDKKIKHPAVKMKKRKAKLLAQLTYCCIPATVVKTEVVEYEDGTKQVVNSDIKPNGNGAFGTTDKYYKEIKAKRVAYLNEVYSGKSVKGHKHRRKQPWYMLTKGKCYNYEERKTSYGACTKFFRVKSEQGLFHNLYNMPKFTKEEFIIRLLSAKTEEWEKKNPKPTENDLFYSQEINEWINKYETEFDSRLVNVVHVAIKETRNLANIIATTTALSNERICDFVGELRNKYMSEKKVGQKEAA